MSIMQTGQECKCQDFFFLQIYLAWILKVLVSIKKMKLRTNRKVYEFFESLSPLFTQAVALFDASRLRQHWTSSPWPRLLLKKFRATNCSSIDDEIQETNLQRNWSWYGEKRMKTKKECALNLMNELSECVQYIWVILCTSKFTFIQSFN